MPENEDSQITQQEIDDIVAGMISDEELRARSEALDKAQEVFEEVAYLHNPKMPCPECTGAGQVAGGTLGDICVRCLGQRVVEQPGSVPLEMPPFATMRAAITAYGDARADRALPDGDDGTPHKGRRNLALPPAATVPTLAQIAEIHASGLEMAKQLTSGPGLVPQHLLPDHKPEKGMRSEGGLDEHDDAELDEMEKADLDEPKKTTKPSAPKKKTAPPKRRSR